VNGRSPGGPDSFGLSAEDLAAQRHRAILHHVAEGRKIRGLVGATASLQPSPAYQRPNTIPNMPRAGINTAR
jgi:hypothetical protein